eukprot:1397041-Amphidinium_carterae.1
MAQGYKLSECHPDPKPIGTILAWRQSKVCSLELQPKQVGLPKCHYCSHTLTSGDCHSLSAPPGIDNQT